MSKARRGKVRDKWREKSWITVETPQSFGSLVIAQIPASDPEKVLGRVVETTLFDILKQDPQQYSIKLYFQTVKVEENRALTILKGQEYSRDYLRSLVRRGSSMVNLIKDYTTLDGYKIRVYVVAFTQFRVNSSRKRAIREAMDKVLSDKIAKTTYDLFSQEVVYGKVGEDIFTEAKKVTQIRQLGVRKVKLISMGKFEMKVEQVTPAS
ncbi:MAG: 30S ribosomal protein S3ae [Nitrososphaerales archaeon]|nr:30S ribosomal protein S3ae [Nitrososphaerales archaeon]